MAGKKKPTTASNKAEEKLGLTVVSGEAKEKHLTTPGDAESPEGKGACHEGCPDENPASGITPHELGRRGERAARRFLQRRGYEILDMNWGCTFGEADIVALDGDTLCFVEVKTRRGAEKGFPEEAVTTRKRTRYEKIAGCYLRDHDFLDMRVRFDVVSIMVIGDDRAFLRMHTNAFGDGSVG